MWWWVRVTESHLNKLLFTIDDQSQYRGPIPHALESQIKSLIYTVLSNTIRKNMNISYTVCSQRCANIAALSSTFKAIIMHHTTRALNKVQILKTTCQVFDQVSTFSGTIDRNIDGILTE